MLTTLDWKDVLRPIRDGYRHLFPSPDTGPTPEERQRQRALDQQLRGFTYFDMFCQLENWTPDDADTVQRANTPLLRRSQAGGDSNKAKVLLCHDYSGGYHDYESAQGVGVDEESYSCEYLQFVDTFVYFSHKLACVPPPSWTNALHRNGVKVLGTILIEPQTKSSERLLQRSSISNSADDTTSFPMAKILANIAKHYGFDGWLINIETPFCNERWDPHILETFLQQLKDSLGVDGQVVWYDAITTANKINYQNALTAQNLDFSAACGCILTNYCWEEADAWDSKRIANENSLAQDSVFFGVDVWAQNSTNLTHPRVTYPRKGGGGTNTGVAIRKIAEVGLSVGIFASAWSFEHFPGHGRAVERAMWDGISLPANLECSCRNAMTRHPSNREYFITQSACHFPAGSETYFYTDFCRAFARRAECEYNKVWADKSLHSQLASQSILPHMSNSSVRDDDEDIESSVNFLSLRLDNPPTGACLVVEAQSMILSNDTTHERWLPFFKLDILTTEPLDLRILSQYVLDDPSVSASYYLKFSNDVLKFYALGQPGHLHTIEATLISESKPAGVELGKLQELGLHLLAPSLGPAQESVRVAEVMEICITPASYSRTVASAKYGIPSQRPEDCYDPGLRLGMGFGSGNKRLSTFSNGGEYMILNVRVERCGDAESSHYRLRWTYNDGNGNSNTKGRSKAIHHGVPHSDVTGPFSYFWILVDDVEVGRAYALEHILMESLVGCLRGDGGEVQLLGIGFDGRRIAEKRVWLKL